MSGMARGHTIFRTIARKQVQKHRHLNSGVHSPGESNLILKSQTITQSQKKHTCCAFGYEDACKGDVTGSSAVKSKRGAMKAKGLFNKVATKLKSLCE